MCRALAIDVPAVRIDRPRRDDRLDDGLTPRETDTLSDREQWRTVTTTFCRVWAFSVAHGAPHGRGTRRVEPDRGGARDALSADVQRRASVTLVSDGAQLRGELVRYLTEAGFDVELSAFPTSTPHRSTSLVWLPDRDLPQEVVSAAIATWLERARRAVLVTWSPRAYRDAIEMHGERLVVLVPPVFGWQLVDALRPPNAERPSW
jgi:hypothetical protein